MKIKHIIFDLDGTLIDSSTGIIEAFNYALDRLNLPPQPPEKIIPLIGFPLDIMFRKFTENQLEDLKVHFKEKAKQTVVASSRSLPGAEEAVTSLFNKGFKLGIATTKIRHHIDGILKKLGWEELFHSVIGGDEVSKVKPDREQFQTLLRRMEGTNEETIVVGDTINDVLPARELSIPVIAISSPYGGSEDVRRLSPDCFIEGIEELTEVIEEFNKVGVTER